VIPCGAAGTKTGASIMTPSGLYRSPDGPALPHFLYTANNKMDKSHPEADIRQREAPIIQEVTDPDSCQCAFAMPRPWGKLRKIQNVFRHLQAQESFE
jgi:hypothetical protein